MSRKDRAVKRDVDYRILGRTGEKVDIDRKMEDIIREKRVMEMQLCDDIDEAFKLKD